MLSRILGLVFALVAVPAFGSDLDDLPCWYVTRGAESALDRHPGCAWREGGQLRVSPEHRRRMSEGENGLAIASIEGAWYYLKPDGALLEVVTFDNGPDDFSEGLVRSPVGDRIAYCDADFQVVVEPRYHWGWPFEDGRALVCLGCARGTPDLDGHWAPEGGLWGYIDRAGREIGPLMPRGEDSLAR